MTYAAYEDSFFNATPERLFLFEMGLDRWAYVCGQENVVRLGVTYSPMIIEMDALVQSLAENTPTINIRVLTDAAVTSNFIAYQPFKPMRVRVFRHHFGDPDNEYKTELIGEVISSSFDEEDRTCTLSVRMIAHAMDRKVPWPAYQRACNHALYGPGCKAPIAPFTTLAPTASAVGSVITAGIFSTHPDGWFTNGFATTSKGESRFVIEHIGTNIRLQTPFVDFDPTNDSITAYAGCDLLKTTCETKFNNLVNYLGFMWIGEKNPFTDNVYGTGATLGTSGSKTNWRKAINPAGWNGSWGLF